MAATFIKVEIDMGIRHAVINTDDIISITQKGVYKSEIKLRNGDIIIATEAAEDIYERMSK